MAFKTSEGKAQERAAKAERKAKERAREKALHAAEQEAKKKARQKVVRYDREGNLIGDDGYLMTKARMRLHRLYDGYFIWMVVSFLAAVLCICLSYFQGQQLTDWELVAYGGNEFHGLSVASLLRVEALFLLFVTAASLYTNMKGMAWLYDGGALKPVKVVMALTGVVGAVYFAVVLFVSGIPDPASAITVVMALLMGKFILDVSAEKGTLKRAHVAKTVVKKG